MIRGLLQGLRPLCDAFMECADALLGASKETGFVLPDGFSRVQSIKRGDLLALVLQLHTYDQASLVDRFLLAWEHLWSDPPVTSVSQEIRLFQQMDYCVQYAKARAPRFASKTADEDSQRQQQNTSGIVLDSMSTRSVGWGQRPQSNECWKLNDYKELCGSNVATATLLKCGVTNRRCVSGHHGFVCFCSSVAFIDA